MTNNASHVLKRLQTERCQLQDRKLALFQLPTRDQTEIDQINELLRR